MATDHPSPLPAFVSAFSRMRALMLESGGQKQGHPAAMLMLESGGQKAREEHGSEARRQDQVLGLGKSLRGSLSAVPQPPLSSTISEDLHASLVPVDGGPGEDIAGSQVPASGLLASALTTASRCQTRADSIAGLGPATSTASFSDRGEPSALGYGGAAPESWQAPHSEQRLRFIISELQEVLQLALLEQHERTHKMLGELRQDVMGMQAALATTPRSQTAAVAPPELPAGSESEPDQGAVPPTTPEAPAARPDGPELFEQEEKLYSLLNNSGDSPVIRARRADITISPAVAAPPSASQFKGASESLSSHFDVYHAETAHLDVIFDLADMTWKAAASPPRRSFHRKNKYELVLGLIALILVLANAVFVGITENLAVQTAFDGGVVDQKYYLPVEITFTSVMFVEWVASFIVSWRKDYFRDSLAWTIFDFVLILSGALQVILVGAGFSEARCLSFLRAFRVIKFVRVMPRLRTLRLFYAMVGTASTSFFWAMFAVAFFVYAYSILVTQRVSRAIPDLSQVWIGSDVYDTYEDWAYDVRWLYGSLPTTMSTLLATVSGGVDWLDAARPLRYIAYGNVMFAGYMTFVFGMVFFVSNILIALMVQNTNDVSRFDVDVVIEEKVYEEQDQKYNLTRAFAKVSQSQPGFITRGEMFVALRDPWLHAYLQAMDVSSAEVWGVFNFLDRGGTDKVELESFVRKIIILRGTAKNVDLVSLIYAHKQSAKVMDAFQRQTLAKLENLTQLTLSIHAPVQPVAAEKVGNTGALRKASASPAGPSPGVKNLPPLNLRQDRRSDFASRPARLQMPSQNARGVPGHAPQLETAPVVHAASLMVRNASDASSPCSP